MILVLPVVLFAFASAAPAPDPVPDHPAVAAARAAEAGGLVAGVSYRHLESGRAASWRGTETFQMASVFKLPVAIAVLDAVEREKLRLDGEVEIREKDRMEVGPIYDEWKPGMRVTIARMVDVMLVDSDNTAADVLVAQLGGPAAVEKALVAKGVTGVKVSLDERGLGAAMRMDLDAIERGAQNGTSPDAMAGLLVRLFRGELLSKDSTDRILDSMRRCATSGRRFRAGLPKGAEVFDKTGTMRLSSNDVGILTLRDGSHAVLAVFTRGGAGAEAREKAIASIAKAAWEAGAPAR